MMAASPTFQRPELYFRFFRAPRMAGFVASRT